VHHTTGGNLTHGGHLFSLFARSILRGIRPAKAGMPDRLSIAPVASDLPTGQPRSQSLGDVACLAATASRHDGYEPGSSTCRRPVSQPVPTNDQRRPSPSEVLSQAALEEWRPSFRSPIFEDCGSTEIN
jgi:hypothetical protein